MEISELYRTAGPAGELLRREVAAFSLLEGLGIPYAWVSGEPADTMAECAVVSEVLASPSARIFSSATGRRRRSTCCAWAATSPFRPRF